MKRILSQAILTFTILACALSTHTKENFKTITLTPQNSVIINSQIDQVTIYHAAQELLLLDKQRTSTSKPIFIVLNSPGGSITDGNNFIRLANTIPNVHTICMFCASMAHAISQAMHGVRFATPDNTMMAHKYRVGLSGKLEEEKAESRLALFKAIIKAMEQRSANRIGISLKQYKQNVKNDWWTYGEDSKKQHVIDEIINIKCSRELIDLKKSTYIQTTSGISEGPEKSACPLVP